GGGGRGGGGGAAVVPPDLRRADGRVQPADRAATAGARALRRRPGDGPGVTPLLCGDEMTVPPNAAALTVRRMAPGEVGLIRDWADAEGWNPGTHDGPAFLAADPDGFFVGELAGEPVGCLSCVRYGEAFGFFGQFIVR